MLSLVKLTALSHEVKRGLDGCNHVPTQLLVYTALISHGIKELPFLFFKRLNGFSLIAGISLS